MTNDAPEQADSRCGYVALVGRPNVGKSTLMNHLLRQKIAITSRKPQTTRHLLLGVDTEGNAQAIYVDTPGIHDFSARDTRREINRYMVRAATAALHDVDLVLLLVERDQWTREDQRVVDELRRTPVPKLAVINKIDQLPRRELLLPVMARLGELDLFDAIVPVSALKGSGLDVLREEIFARLPHGPHLFPRDQVTDQSERFLVGEIIREKLMRRLGEELPHRLAVVVERFEDDGELVDIAADIYVERAGQKRIVVGQGGEKLKSIGQQARADIERFLERPVMLRLWVKVRRGWTNDPAALRRLGYE